MSQATGAQLSVVQDPAAPGATYTIVAFSAAGCAAGAKVDEVAPSSTSGEGTTASPFLMAYSRTTAGQLWFQVVVTRSSSSATSNCFGGANGVVIGERWCRGASVRVQLHALFAGWMFDVAAAQATACLW